MSDMLSVHVESVEAAFIFSFLLNDEERELLDIYFDVQDPSGGGGG